MTRVCTTALPPSPAGAARVISEPPRLEKADGGWDVEALVAWSRSGNAHVRHWATSALAVHDADSGGVRGALLDRLADPQRETRDQALLGLAVRRDRRAIGPLLRALDEDVVDPVLIGAASCLACGELVAALETLRRGGRGGAVLGQALARCRGLA